MRHLSLSVVLAFILLCVGCGRVIQSDQCIAGDCKSVYSTYQFSTGAVYAGHYENGKANGLGTIIWSDGRKYEGEFRDDKANGQGTMTWPDGRKYVGQWLDYRRFGSGTTNYGDGRVLSGLWADSKLTRDFSSEEFASILPTGPAVQVDNTDNLAERQRKELERQRLKLQKAQVAERPKSSKNIETGERRTALVIGNGAYQRGALRNPANDARDMAVALKNSGFDVTILTDATQSQMENAVRNFGTKLRQGGVGLFYFAGHGVQVSGENFLIPVNAVIQSEGDVKFGSVNAGLVLAKMEDAGNDLNIVILDACRSNPYARSFRTANEGLAKMDAPTGSIISYATAPGSVAADGSGRNGVFTRHLLENMKTPGLPISEVLMRVRQGVVRETAKKQVPWEASSLIGKFYFAE